MFKELTDEQCDDYWISGLEFDDMIRKAYRDGYQQCHKDIDEPLKQYDELKQTGIVML
jgi:hypothetical protein